MVEIFFVTTSLFMTLVKLMLTKNIFDFQVNDNLKRQENTMKELSETNEQFVKENGGQNSNNNARDEMLKKLAAAHDAYFELQNNLQEGTKFYNDLTQLLVTFQNKVMILIENLKKLQGPKTREVKQIKSVKLIHNSFHEGVGLDFF